MDSSNPSRNVYSNSPDFSALQRGGTGDPSVSPGHWPGESPPRPSKARGPRRSLIVPPGRLNSTSVPSHTIPQMQLRHFRRPAVSVHSHSSYSSHHQKPWPSVARSLEGNFEMIHAHSTNARQAGTGGLGRNWDFDFVRGSRVAQRKSKLHRLESQ